MVCIIASYNYFYQTIYGPDLTVTPPPALLAYFQPLEITSHEQLEALFVLWNAAQPRSPIYDPRCTSRSATVGKTRSSRFFPTNFAKRQS